MQGLSRRVFLRNTAWAAGGAVVLPVLSGGWHSLAGAAETPGYFEREFGITDALCRKILAEALAKGGDFADLYFEHTIANYLTLEDGKVSRAFGEVALGVGIRTVKGDQVGFGFTQQLDQGAMLAAAATAATIASGAAVKPAAELVWAKLADTYPLDRLLSSVPVESKVPLVQSVNEKCFSLSPLVVKVTGDWQIKKNGDKKCFRPTDFKVLKMASGREPLVGLLAVKDGVYTVALEDHKIIAISDVPPGLKKLVGQKVIVDVKSLDGAAAVPLQAKAAKEAASSLPSMRVVITYQAFP